MTESRLEPIHIDCRYLRCRWLPRWFPGNRVRSYVFDGLAIWEEALDTAREARASGAYGTFVSADGRYATSGRVVVEIVPSDEGCGLT